MAVLAAHPDDETIGAAAQFADMASLLLVHLTDGVPSRRAARAHGFADRAAYRAARRQELLAALRAAGATAERHCLDLPDGLASFHLRRAATGLAALLARWRADILLTHAYEGGHPDHDAAAWIARAAGAALHPAPALWEMAGYHAAGGRLQHGAFIAASGEPGLALTLAEPQRARRAAALACFASQQATLAPVPRGEERFRPAPACDFARPPHAGRLHYEARRRALRGAQWRRLAARPWLGPLLAWPAALWLAR